MSSRRGMSMIRCGVITVLGVVTFASQDALAHCDTMDGPVVLAAKRAIEIHDVTPVLKWVQEEDESQIREAFRKTLIVRPQSEDARELADMYFFETLVRIHRAGEGAPYTGLKPAGTDPGPVVTASDKALEDNSVDALVSMVTAKVEDGIRKRFAHANETAKRANQTVEAGREFVRAYVEFVHYAERVYEAATALHAHGVELAGSGTEHGQPDAHGDCEHSGSHQRKEEPHESH